MEIIFNSLADSANKPNEQPDLESLVVENQQLRFVLKAINEASIIAITDRAGKIIYANDTFCKICQYSQDELIGQNHRILKSGFHNSDFYDEMWRTISAGKMWEGEVKNRAKDGSFYWVHTYISPIINERGFPDKYVSIRYLITERKETEEKLNESKSKLLEAQRIGRIGSCEINLITNIVELKDGLAEMLGFDSTIRFIDYKDYVAHFNPATITQINRDLNEIFEKQETDFSFEFAIRRQNDGEIIFVKDSGKIEYLNKNPIKIHCTIQDITQTKRLLDQLSKSHNFIESLTLANPNDLYIIDIKTMCISYSNRHQSGITGYDFDDITNQKEEFISNLIYPGDWHILEAGFEEAANLREDNIVHKVFRIRKKDGLIRWVAAQAAPLDRDNKSVTKIVVSLADIHELKSHQEEIESQRNRLDAILENSEDCIFGLDNNARIIFANSAYFDFRRNVVGKPLVEGKYILDNLEKEDIAFWTPIYSRCLSGEKISLEKTFHTPSGVKYFHYNLNPILDYKGEVVGVAGSSKNITSRVLKEIQLEEIKRRLELALNVARIGYWEIHQSKEHSYWDNNMYDIFGIKPQKKGFDRHTFESMIYPDDMESVNNFIDNLSKNYGRFSIDHKIIQPSGELRTIYVVAEKVASRERGEVIHGICIDITERKIVEEKLQKTIFEKDRLMSIIAHDLRSPFSGFLGLLEMINREYAELNDDEIKEILSTLELSAHSLFSLIENLLEWSKSQSINTLFQAENINIKTICDEVITLQSVNAGKKHITISKNINPQHNVIADGNCVETILRNLISNAVKFTQEYGEIMVSSAEFGNKVRITVEDSGVGMSQTQIQNLFKLDKTATRHGTSGEKGAGLGLILCKELTELNKGNLEVESVVGVGTSFSVYLPKATKQPIQ